MATNEKIDSLETMVEELYSSRNTTNIELAKVTTRLQLLTDQNKELIQVMKDNTAKFIEASEAKDKRFSALVWKVLSVIILFFGATLLAIIYGAIGKEGLKSVRESMPNVPTTGMAIESWHDPLRGFLARENV